MAFHHLYPSTLLVIKVYVIVVVILAAIGFFFTSFYVPEQRINKVTNVKQTNNIEETTTVPVTFIPSAEAEHKLVMFTSVTPMWEFLLQENSFISSPENGNVKALAA